MPATVRTIRKLDELPEQKTVRGIEIEKGIPVPPQNHARRTPGVEACLTIEVGESFVYSSLTPVRAKEVKNAGRRFTARQLGPKRFRIWRMK